MRTVYSYIYRLYIHYRQLVAPYEPACGTESLWSMMTAAKMRPYLTHLCIHVCVLYTHIIPKDTPLQTDT